MALIRCRLCGTLFNSERRKYCVNCMKKLDALYGRVHEYMRDNNDEDFDIYTLADAMDITTQEVQALVELGYIERDLQTYGKKKKSDGGVVYSRDKDDDERQYVFDVQKQSKRLK